MKRTLGSCVVLSILSFSAFGQSNPDQDRKDLPTPEQIANYKRIWELLRHPTFISIRLVSTGRDVPNEPPPSTTPAPYVVGETLHFQSFMTQSSNEKLLIIGDRSPYYAYRPQLIRDGDVVPYTKHAQERIENAEGGSSGYSNAPTIQESGREYRSNEVRLEDWYDLPIKAGHYQLTIKRRFTGDGDWIESNPVTFEVVPTGEPQIPKPQLIVTAQTDLDLDLDALDQKLKHQLETKMPGWSYQRIEPIQGSTGVLIQVWKFQNRAVRIVAVSKKSAAEAKESMRNFPRNVKEAQPSSEAGDEGYAWGYELRQIHFRRGKIIFDIEVGADVVADADAKNLTAIERGAREKAEVKKWTKEFANHVVDAVDAP